MADVVLKPVQPDEAIAYFRQKGYRIGFDHRDVWQQEHQAAFTVAKAMQLDVLRDIRGAVDKALTKGTTFGDFQRELGPKLQARGWWGKQEMTDPVTGERKLAQLGSPKRMEVIFDTNMATAYSEGQWERIQRNKEIFPFLQYQRSASSHPRVSHLAYAGLVLRADDPFWQRHMPIKEYGCKCGVVQFTGRMLEHLGIKLGTAPKEVMRTVTNTRTGDEMQVPVGVDPAFNYAPGGRRANLGRMLMDKAEASSAATAARVLADGVDQWMPLVRSEFQEFVGRFAAGERAEIGTRRVVGVLSPATVDAMAATGQRLARSTMAIEAPQLDQLLGAEAGAARAGRVELVSSLPDLLTRVGERWMDEDGRLVLLCSSDEPGMVARIVVAPGQVANAITSLDLVRAQDFDRRGLRPIGNTPTQ
ncbi:phage head morphogenesis protein [Variovorax gossypii]